MIYVDFSAVVTLYIILHSMLLLSGQRENYCFKDIKPLLIVYSLSNLSPQVNIVHKRGHGMSWTVTS